MSRPSPLKAAAAARGLSLVDVARVTGYSSGTVSQVSRGSVQPWPEFRRRMADLFGADPFEESAIDEAVRRVVDAAPRLTTDQVAMLRSAGLRMTAAGDAA